ncbi:MAG: hypothetical protein KKF80_00950, partial [Candidatus Omnitrophica bacterium]|nr:hypothetical protein [Candidatus Omnitrophota bacterium]
DVKVKDIKVSSEIHTKNQTEFARAYPTKLNEYEGVAVLETLHEITVKDLGKVKAKPVFYFRYNPAENRLDFFGKDKKEADAASYTNVVGWSIEGAQEKAFSFKAKDKDRSVAYLPVYSVDSEGDPMAPFMIGISPKTGMQTVYFFDFGKTGERRLVETGLAASDVFGEDMLKAQGIGATDIASAVFDKDDKHIGWSFRAAVETKRHVLAKGRDLIVTYFEVITTDLTGTPMTPKKIGINPELGGQSVYLFNEDTLTERRVIDTLFKANTIFDEETLGKLSVGLDDAVSIVLDREQKHIGWAFRKSIPETVTVKISGVDKPIIYLPAITTDLKGILMDPFEIGVDLNTGEQNVYFYRGEERVLNGVKTRGIAVVKAQATLKDLPLAVQKKAQEQINGLKPESAASFIFYYTDEATRRIVRDDLAFGYALEGEQRKLQLNGKSIDFLLVSQIDTTGEVTREFGMVAGKELLRFSPDRMMVEVSFKEGFKELATKEETGASFIVYERADGTFVKAWKIHSSLDLTYEDLAGIKIPMKKNGIELQASLKEVIDHRYQQLRGTYDTVVAPDKLTWFRLNVLGASGEVVNSLIVGLEQGSRRVLYSNGFLDYAVEKYAGADRLSGRSLRFDPDRNIDANVATSIYLTPEISLVIDREKEDIFVERRYRYDPYLMEKWPLEVVRKITNARGEELDFFASRDAEEVTNFLQSHVNVAYDKGMPVGIDAQGFLRVDRREQFYYEYNDVVKGILAELKAEVGQEVFTVEELKKLEAGLGEYMPTALRAYGVPAFTVTRVINPNNGTLSASVSMFQGIETNVHGPAIVSVNKAIVYDYRMGKKILGTDVKEEHTDFRGNVFIREELSERSNDAVTYVFSFDKYGRGGLSIRTMVPEDKQRTIDSASLFSGNYPATKLAAFLKFEGNFMAVDEDGAVFGLDNTIDRNYEILRAARLFAKHGSDTQGLPYSELQNLSFEFTDGQGRALVRLSAPRVNLASLMYGDDDVTSWGRGQAIRELASRMDEIAFLNYRPQDIEKIYISLVASRIPFEAWSHKAKRDEQGSIIIDEAAYESERNDGILSRLFGKRYLDHTYNPRFIKGSVLLAYDVINNRPGYANGIKVATLSGKPVKEIVPYTLVKVMMGILGNSTSGDVTIHYDALGMPVEAKLSDGRVVETWSEEGLGIRFYADSEGGIRTVMHKRVQRPLGRPGQRDDLETTLLNGYIKDERRLGIKENWASELRGGWYLAIIPLVVLAILVMLGKIFDIVRVLAHKAKLVGDIRAQATIQERQMQQSASPAATLAPTYKGYGFDDEVIKSAKYRFNGELGNEVLGGAVTSRLARGETVAQVAVEYFESYNVTRKTVFGLAPLDFSFMDENEVIEMLWISFLIRSGSIYAHNDTPSYLNYLIHRALEEYKTNPDTVGTMVRTHVDRWWAINHWTSTTFKSFGPPELRKAANTLPAQYLFTIEDLEELFRVPAFVKRYDNLGNEGRKKLYDDYLLPEIIKYAEPLKGKVLELADRYSDHKIRIKKAIVKTQEYKSYVKFLEGQWTKERPLFLKTYPDTIGFKGLGPLKTWLHTFRNLYQPLAIPFQVVIFALGAALYLQMNNPAIHLSITAPFIAALVVGLTIALWSGRPVISYFLNRGFEKRVNTHAYGKPLGVGVGYQKPIIPLKLKLFRYAFWATLLTVKGIWDAVVLYIVLYAHANIVTGTWLLFGVNINMVLVAGLWFPFVLFFFLDTFSIYYAFEALWGYAQARFIGLGNIKTEGRKEALRTIRVPRAQVSSSAALGKPAKDDLLIAMIKRNFIPSSLRIDGKPLTARMQDVVVAEMINLALRTMYNEDMISLQEYQANAWGIERAEGAGFYEATVTQPSTLFSGLRNSKARSRIYRFLNQLFMDKPEMPTWEELKSLSIMTPTGPGEHIFYPWEGDPEVGLNVRMNSGHTPLTYIIKRHPDEWQNFLNRMQRESSINPADLATLQALQYGEVIKIADEKLIMKLREWGSLRVQPYYRTLNGKFHYVPVLQLFAKINHPEWDKEKIAQEVNKKYQIVWGSYLRTFEYAEKPDLKDKFTQIFD